MSNRHISSEAHAKDGLSSISIKVVTTPKPAIEISYKDKLGEVNRNVELPENILSKLKEPGLDDLAKLSQNLANHVSYLWMVIDDYFHVKAGYPVSYSTQPPEAVRALRYYASEQCVGEIVDNLELIKDASNPSDVLAEIADEFQHNHVRIIRDLRDIIKSHKKVVALKSFVPNKLEKDIDDYRQLIANEDFEYKEYIGHVCNLYPATFPDKEKLMADKRQAFESLYRALDSFEAAWLKGAEILREKMLQADPKFPVPKALQSIALEDAPKLAGQINGSLIEAKKKFEQLHKDMLPETIKEGEGVVDAFKKLNISTYIEDMEEMKSRYFSNGILLRELIDSNKHQVGI